MQSGFVNWKSLVPFEVVNPFCPETLAKAGLVIHHSERRRI